MPPSGFNEKAIKGLLVFISECYEDLLKEIDSGSEPKNAIQKELENIRSFLKDFHL
jgi:hypothetical protein